MVEKKDASDLIVKVSFSLPFCLYIEDDNYQVQMPSYIATISTKRKKQEHIDPRLGVEEATTELIRDRYGRLRYTSVEVKLAGQVVIEQETKRRIREGEMQTEGSIVEVSLGINDLISEYSDAAFEESIAVANYFVAVYREVTHDFYIKTFSTDDIYCTTINWFDKNELIGGTEHMGFGKGMSLEPIGLSPATDQQFRQRLRVYKPPSLYTELALNARDYLDIGNYRMAVIESRTCIEVVIDQLLLDDFTRKGKTIEDAKKLLKVDKLLECATIEDVLEEAKMNIKLKRGLKEAIGRSLAEDSDLWSKWLKAKSSRERAVHRAVDISETDAKDAVDTLAQIFDFIVERK